jgi:hypothetical protein
MNGKARLLMDISLYRRERICAIPPARPFLLVIMILLLILSAIVVSGRIRSRNHLSNFRFCIRDSFPYDERVLELEVYAAGVRDLNKILELDIELEAIPGLHYKVDRNHDIVYMELEAPTVSFREIRSIFRKLGLDPKFVGAIPAELRPKTKTQLLEA